MKTKSVIFSLLIAAALMVSCKDISLKKPKASDPIDVIETLSNDISSESDDWSKEDWDDAADLLENALDNLPDPMTNDESTIVSSAVSRMKVYGERNEVVI